MTDREPDGAAMNTDKPESRDARISQLIKKALYEIGRCNYGGNSRLDAAEGFLSDASALLDREGRVPANDEPAPGTLDEQLRGEIAHAIREASWSRLSGTLVEENQADAVMALLRSRAAPSDAAIRAACETYDATHQGGEGEHERAMRAAIAVYIRRSAKP